MNWWNLVPGVPLDIYKANDNWDFNKDSTEVNTSLFCELDGLGQINLSSYERALKGTGITGSTTVTAGTYNWSAYLPDFHTMRYYSKNMGGDGIITIGYTDASGNLYAGRFNLKTKTWTNTHTIAQADLPATTGLSGTYTHYSTICWEMEVNDSDELVLTIWVNANNSAQTACGWYACCRAYNSNNTIKTSSTMLIDSDSQSSSYEVYYWMGFSYRPFLTAKDGNNVRNFTELMRDRYTISSGAEVLNRFRVIVTYNGTTFSNSKTTQHTSGTLYYPTNENWWYLLNNEIYTISGLTMRNSGSTTHYNSCFFYKLSLFPSATYTQIDENSQSSVYAGFRAKQFLDYFAYDFHYETSSSRYPDMRFYYRDNQLYRYTTSGSQYSTAINLNCMEKGVEAEFKGYGPGGGVTGPSNFRAHRNDTETLATITKFSDIRLVNNADGTRDWYFYLDDTVKKYYALTTTNFTILDDCSSSISYSHTPSEPLTDLNKLFTYSVLFVNTLFVPVYSDIIQKLTINDGINDYETNAGTWEVYNGDVANVQLRTEGIGHLLYPRTTRSYVLLYKQ